MNIAIIDAEIIGKKSHRFPNLASMKLSAYYKSKGHNVTLIWDYFDLFSGCYEVLRKGVVNDIPHFMKNIIKRSETIDGKWYDKTVIRYYQKNDICYDKIIISKVFTDTEVPQPILDLDICEYGGTGFYYDKAPALPEEIEHIMPDYHLYDEWINIKIAEKLKGKSEQETEKILKFCNKEFTYYKDYSIGFLTRGCFRQCQFCVNRNKKYCVKHSNVAEFMDVTRPRLCFLDDNFFACPEWKAIIEDVKSTGKYFQFKQGLDERLLTEDKIHEMMTWKYDGRKIFAFDNIQDKELIESKLQKMLELYPKGLTSATCFYVLVGYDRNKRWDKNFWIQDIKDAFERCMILAKYSASPYIMRYETCYDCEFINFYNVLAAWANQVSFFKKICFADFCVMYGMDRGRYSKFKQDPQGYLNDGGKKGASWRMLEWFKQDYPDIVNEYFYKVPDEISIAL